MLLEDEVVDVNKRIPFKYNGLIPGAILSLMKDKQPMNKKIEIKEIINWGTNFIV